MNKTCARCEKIVYPIEELKCLDKIWHKGCFKCQECSMTLNMRTYKGYGKLPYCEAHIPKVKPTTMADTPELKRIAENSKLQSNVKYHADFEKSKGKFTQVADDPETLRIKANSKIISNAAYHGTLETKAAMERQRTINDNGEVVESTDNYHIQLENYAAEMLPPTVAPPAVPAAVQLQATTYPAPIQPASQKSAQQEYQHNANQSQPQYRQQQQTTQQMLQSQQRQAEYANNYNANVTPAYQNPPSHYNQTSLPNVQISSYVSNVPPGSMYDDYKPEPDYNNQRNSAQIAAIQSYGADSYYERGGSTQQTQQQQRIGRIADYDPISDGPRNSPLMPKHSATIVYSSGPPHQTVQSHQNMQHHHNLTQNQPNQNPQHQNASHGHQNASHGHPNAPHGHQNALHGHQNASHGHPNAQQSHQNMQQTHQNMQQQTQQLIQQQKIMQQQQQQQQILHQANNGRIGGHQSQQSPQSRRIGSVADMDPVNDPYGGSNPMGSNPMVSAPAPGQHAQQQAQQLMQQQLAQRAQREAQQAQRDAQREVQRDAQRDLQRDQRDTQRDSQRDQRDAQRDSQRDQREAKNNVSVSGRVYIAMYDYEATDTDEVSFCEGDLITNVSSIDEGWMTGRVERTGHTGMLPANYVEVAQI